MHFNQHTSETPSTLSAEQVTIATTPASYLAQIALVFAGKPNDASTPILLGTRDTNALIDNNLRQACMANPEFIFYLHLAFDALGDDLSGTLPHIENSNNALGRFLSLSAVREHELMADPERTFLTRAELAHPSANETSITAYERAATIVYITLKQAKAYPNLCSHREFQFLTGTVCRYLQAIQDSISSTHPAANLNPEELIRAFGYLQRSANPALQNLYIQTNQGLQHDANFRMMSRMTLGDMPIS